MGDYMYRKKNVFLILIFTFIFMFFGLNNVKAVTRCDYGIQCKYSLSNLRESVGGGYLMGGGYLYVTFQCSDNSKSFSECSSFIAKAAASKQDMSANAFFETGGNPGEDIPISNYNDLFGSNANSFKNNFSTDNKFSCPVMYYIGEESNSKVKLGFSKFGVGASGRTSFTADPLANPSCIEQGVTVDEDDLQDQATDDASNAYADEETGKNDAKDNNASGGVDTQVIVDWAQNHGYGNGVTSLGDPCTVINPELQDILSGAFWLISIVGIVLLVVMTAISFIKAIVGSDDEKLKEAFKHLVTRIIVVIILLLLPMLLTFIITLINDSAEGEISVGADGNIFCDVSGSSSDNASSGDTSGGTAVIDKNTGEMTQ